MDWELGIHGLRISFYARNKRYGACYLPDVAVEQGWDKEETIVSLMRKAGWSGRTERWNEVGDLKCVRFQGKAESAGWEEYKNWKEWVQKGANGED
jgi:AMMECR1 domain-containing protein